MTINEKSSYSPLGQAEQDIVIVNVDSAPGHGEESPRMASLNEPEVGEDSTEDRARSVRVGAGVVSGVAGFLICGPVLALAAGFGVAYATTKDGPNGDRARAVGEWALKTRDCAERFNQRHNVIDKTKSCMKSTWKKAKEIDERHGVVQNIKDCLAFSVKATSKLITDLNRNGSSDEGSREYEKELTAGF